MGLETQCLETSRLILRPPRPSDAMAITAALHDFEVVKMLARPPWPYRLEHAREWLAAAPLRRAQRSAFPFMIVPKGVPHPPVGCIGLDRRDDGQMHLGFWMARAYWGRGMMGEAAEAMLRFGFETLDLPRIHSGCFRDNAGSRAVHRRLGFSVVGEDALYCAPRAATLPHICLALTRADWRARLKPESLAAQ